MLPLFLGETMAGNITERIVTHRSVNRALRGPVLQSITISLHFGQAVSLIKALNRAISGKPNGSKVSERSYH